MKKFITCIPFLLWGTLLMKIRRIKMSEVIISRRGSSNGGGSGKLLVTETFPGPYNGNYVVPEGVSELDVMIIAGGDPVRNSWDSVNFGAGGGWNRGKISVSSGQIISLFVGIGGRTKIWNYNYIENSYGEASFFGSYLSANSRDGGSAGWTNTSLFGGGRTYSSTGKDGGIYGGGGGSNRYEYRGGDGGTYGGGGGGSI